MPTLLELLEPEIEATIQRLGEKKFTPDPIAGPKFSRIASVMSSATKRHGYILEAAIVERLKAQPELTVWTDAEFQVARNADLLVNGALSDPDSILGSELGYGPGERALQIDAIVYNNDTGSLRAYEIKRGFGPHNSGKRRQMLRDALCVQLLLRSYGQLKGLDPTSVGSHVIFYYGKMSVRSPIGIRGDELNVHFGFPCREDIETVNQYFGGRFREVLYDMIAH